MPHPINGPLCRGNLTLQTGDGHRGSVAVRGFARVVQLAVKNPSIGPAVRSKMRSQRRQLPVSLEQSNQFEIGDATPAELRRDITLAQEAGLDLIRVHAHTTEVVAQARLEQRELIARQLLSWPQT